MDLISALLVVGACFAGPARGQATTVPAGPAAAGGLPGRPAPARERVEADPGAWWQSSVFYEVFVRSFADSSRPPLGGDGIGDLRGLIERLDYLNDGDPATAEDLGINALWLMPVTDSPTAHGYDTTDYRLIERDYGTNADFLELMAACRARGIRVTIDLVLNHCSSAHPWFQRAAGGDPEYRDWFIWSGADPGYVGPWGQRVWHQSPAQDGSWFYGVFSSAMPDLNYQNPAVTREMLGVVGHWLRDMGVDGFRLDAIRHLIEAGPVQDNVPATHGWLRGYFDYVKSINPIALSVGEVWAGSDDVSRYVGGQMDLAFEFDLAYAIIDAVREGRPGRIVRQLEAMERLYPPGTYATFLRNHDQPRTMHELGGDAAAARLATALQFALPGVPFIYYGEEIGMSGTKPDPEIRTPMQWTGGENAGFTAGQPWIGVKPDFPRVNAAAQSGDPGSMLSHYRRLIRARLGRAALRTGVLEVLQSSDERVLGLLRRGVDGGGGVAAVFNLSGEAVEGARLGFAFSRPPPGFEIEVGPDLLSDRAGWRWADGPGRLEPRAAHYFSLPAAGPAGGGGSR